MPVTCNGPSRRRPHVVCGPCGFSRIGSTVFTGADKVGSLALEPTRKQPCGRLPKWLGLLAAAAACGCLASSLNAALRRVSTTMPAARRITFLPALALVLAACQGLQPPRPETLARIRPMPLASAIRGKFELELRGPGLSGTFDAVCALEGRCCRLQLFPDIGAKVFDLRLEEAEIGRAHV